ncbi:MAG TPA: hypothetical protein PK185_10175 [Cyclobacteriaceae bacterium]|nr:hypothetical protein [Cyclobacteriaceae bacterium]
MKALRPLNFAVFIIGVFSLTAFMDIERTKIEGSPKFLIFIQTIDNGLKLTCEEGCAWKDLTFSLIQNKFQAVDQYGMTSINRAKPSKDKKLSNFLFSIQRTDNGIKLEGKEGTSWTMLNFTCKGDLCNQYIDQDGMIKKE